MVEHLGFARSGRRDEVFVQNLEDILANLGKLRLNLLSVVSDHLDLSFVALGLLLLLNGRDDPPRCSARTNHILVGDRKEIALLDGELLVGRRDMLHVFDHFWD